MATEYVGAVILAIDGQEIDVTSFDEDRAARFKTVKVMNKKTPKGTTRIVPEYKLTCECVVPKGGVPDWDEIRDATLTSRALDGGFVEQYSGVHCTGVKGKYEIENEAMQTIEFSALDYYKNA